MSDDLPPAGPPRGGPQMRGDLTQGPIFRTLILFALPVLFGNVLQSLNASVNTVWVGRMLGEDALAATASSNIVLFLVFGLIFGISMATTVHVGQNFGARNFDQMRKSFGAGLGLCLMLSVAIAVLGWIGAPNLLHLMNVPPASYHFALDYLRVIFLVMPSMTLTVLVASAMRGCGDARTPLYFQILTIVLDITLNPLFIGGIGPFPKLGIVGAATATAIATLTGLAGLIAWLYWRDLPIRLKGRELRYLWPAPDELKYLILKGIPMGLQMLVISGAGVIMLSLINKEGTNFAASYGVLLQLWNYIQMPGLALSAAVGAMVAQHIGARREARVDRISWSGAAANTAFTLVLVALMLVFAVPLLTLFLGSGSPAIPVALHIQHMAIWAYIPFGVTIVLFGTLRSYGAVLVQILVLFTAMYAVRLGIYYALYPRIGSDALWWSLTISSLVSMSLTVLAYYRHPWRERMLARVAEETAF
ncbi:MAG: MATE family efflux transporter [Novosphingobium sp.]